MGNVLCAAIFWLGAGIALALAQSQTPEEFEVASIKPSPPPETTPIVSILSRPGGRWSAENVTVVDLLRYAYPEYSSDGQIVGAPDWTQVSRFHVNAVAEGSPPAQSYRLKVKALIRERFAFNYHVEQRPIEIYVLNTVRPDGQLRGALQPATIDCEAWRASLAKGSEAVEPLTPSGKPACRMSTQREGAAILLSSGSRTMDAIASVIEGFIQPKLPVRNGTQLMGQFYGELRFAIPQNTLNATGTEPETREQTLIDGLREQWGLKVERSRLQTDVMVIDRVERPSPN